MDMTRTRFARITRTSTARLHRFGLHPLVIVAVLILAIVPLFIHDEYVMRLILVSLFFGAQAMVFDFTAGYIGVVNFGFAGFLGAGAYASALMVLNMGVSPWVGLIAATLVAALLGFLTGILTLRLRGIYANCMPWFLALTLIALISAAVELTRGRWGLSVPLFLGTSALRPYYYILLPIAVALYMIMQALVNTKVGLAFRALGQNLDVARASGVDPVRYRVANLTLGCAFAGLLGGYYAHYLGILTPDLLETRNTIEVLTLAYIGGRGSLWGGMVAAFILIPAFEYMKPLMEIRLIIYGLLLIVSMIFYPAGLSGIARRIVERIRARQASAAQLPPSHLAKGG